jgi:rhodanese-related sulfurtransferase
MRYCLRTVVLLELDLDLMDKRPNSKSTSSRMESSTSTTSFTSFGCQWLWRLLLLVLCSLSGGVRAEIIELTSSQFYEMATTGQVDVMLDVRTPEEWDTGHLENSPDPAMTLQELGLWNCRSCRVVVYCRSGARAGAALIELEAAGFDGPLYNGLGVSQWTAQGYSLVNTPSVEDRRCMIIDQDSAISRRGISVCAREAQEEDDTSTEAAVSTSKHQLELDAARDLFLSQMEMYNVTGYSFLFTLECFCPSQDYPWLITAELQTLMLGVKPPTEMVPADNDNSTMPSPVQGWMGDTILSAIDTQGVDVLQQEIEQGFVPTAYSILGLFDKIQEAIDTNASSLEVVYNPEWGYPEEINVDYMQMVVDDGWSVTVTNFTLVDILEYHIAHHPEFNNNTESNQTLAEEMQTELTEQLALWDANNLDEYYFQYLWMTGQDPQDFPWTVHVQNGTVVTVTNIDNVDMMTTPGADRTMDDIFDAVQASIAEGAADSVQVSYLWIPHRYLG